MCIARASFGLEEKEVGFRSGAGNMKINFGLKSSGPRAGTGEILKFRPV
jgi:hypothetical protein